MARSHYASVEISPVKTLPAAALRVVFKEGYTAETLRADILAGIVVGIVALPLAMALAIGVGVPPQYGLYTSVVAGFLVPLLGGSPFFRSWYRLKARIGAFLVGLGHKLIVSHKKHRENVIEGITQLFLGVKGDEHDNN